MQNVSSHAGEKVSLSHSRLALSLSLCEETPSITHAGDDAQRSPPPRRDALTDDLAALRAELSFAPLFLVKNLEPVTSSRIRNAWFPHRIQPLITASISPPPFDRESRYRPFSIALANSQGRSYLASYQASISPPFPLRQCPILHSKIIQLFGRRFL